MSLFRHTPFFTDESFSTPVALAAVTSGNTEMEESFNEDMLGPCFPFVKQVALEADQHLGQGSHAASSLRANPVV